MGNTNDTTALAPPPSEGNTDLLRAQLEAEMDAAATKATAALPRIGACTSTADAQPARHLVALYAAVADKAESSSPWRMPREIARKFAPGGTYRRRACNAGTRARRTRRRGGRGGSLRFHDDAHKSNRNCGRQRRRRRSSSHHLRSSRLRHEQAVRTSETARWNTTTTATNMSSRRMPRTRADEATRRARRQEVERAFLAASAMTAERTSVRRQLLF
ncbi:signal recognition particle subunit SRP68 [Pseudoscourfieldia marina]